MRLGLSTGGLESMLWQIALAACYRQPVLQGERSDPVSNSRRRTSRRNSYPQTLAKAIGLLVVEGMHVRNVEKAAIPRSSTQFHRELPDESSRYGDIRGV